MLSPSPFSLCCVLLLCVPLAFLFTSTNTTTISPPSPLPQDDKSLFRLASRVHPNPSPSNAPKRIAFMFLTTSPLPFAPLWELFFHSNYNWRTAKDNHTPNHDHLFNIYIHADPNSSFYNFSGVFSHQVVHSKPTRRLTSSLVSAARRLLAHALLHDSSNAMFALLSPSCIPLHSFNFTYTTLLSSNKSFIEILKDEPGAYDRWAARGTEVMLPEVPFRDFRVGSQFFVLTRRHAKLVVEDQRLWKKFKLPCVQNDVCYPEEHYFPTLISMQDPFGCVPATLTHVDWRGQSGGHPRTYEAFEVGHQLIYVLRQGRPRYGDEVGGAVNVSDVQRRRHDPFLFARKFSPDSLQPLMNIANDAIFTD
ncbi:hypothetical protein IFM89_008291 [Coptis chinensis]|uniref:Core-2/I-branching beta-1,6-N-acetylglucosaminyltransferase family protein n=1 Tax=Coptis chinensis TaxID=261450 RepID=A0A835IAU3_9MAGN|nr:hypothetical protein IFM89_008291 [Coptis chinensis]